ncbi:MAG: hypothetical protein ACREBS_01440 [Nitrososphaerales archaeon]
MQNHLAEFRPNIYRNIGVAAVLFSIVLGIALYGNTQLAGVTSSATTSNSISTEEFFPSTSTLTQTTTLALGPPNNWLYLSELVGGCTENSLPAPCYSSLIYAYVFNCLYLAATSSGCTQVVANSSNPDINYTIVIWFPYTNPPSTQLNPPNGTAWINCMLSLTQDIGRPYAQPNYEYCIPVNSTAFIIGTSF